VRSFRETRHAAAFALEGRDMDKIDVTEIAAQTLELENARLSACRSELPELASSVETESIDSAQGGGTTADW
jgi:hypothetical protein